MKSLTLILAVASLLIVFITMPAKAGVEIQTPFSGVTWKSGDDEKIAWIDNNEAPLLTDLNSLTFTLMAGTQDSQFTVAIIKSGVAGSTLSLDYTVPANLGPPGAFYFIKVSQGSYLAFSGYFTISGVSGTIPNFNPNNPGTPLSSSAASSSPSSTLSSSANSTSTASASAKSSASASNSAPTNSAASTKSSSSAIPNILGSPTATSVSSSNTGGPTNTPAPTSKSSDSNKLATNSYVLSLVLFIIAFYLY